MLSLGVVNTMHTAMEGLDRKRKHPLRLIHAQIHNSVSVCTALALTRLKSRLGKVNQLSKLPKSVISYTECPSGDTGTFPSSSLRKQHTGFL